MPLNIQIDRDVVVLGNFSRLMNDPRYIDASKDIQALIDDGREKFVLDMGGLRETGSSFLGLLMTITRRIQRNGGEAVLAHVSRQTEEFLVTMQMDDFWDVYPTVKDAVQSFAVRDRHPGEQDEPEHNSD